MRMAAAEFGPVALIELRVATAALFLMTVLAVRGGFGDFRGRIGPMVVVGGINSALPFCLLAYATLSVTAGFASILNATSPLWGGMVAYVWLKDRLTSSRILGLVVGFVGVVVLVWGKASFKPGGSGLAIVAALVATLMYGIAVNFTKRYLPEVNSLAMATGSQISAALLLLPMAVWLWPHHQVSMQAWLGAIVMGVACTGIAYILYFRLIVNVGPAKAIAVTFLIPVFGMLWGALFLAETVTLSMLLGCVVILVGTGLATGLVRSRS